MSEISVVVVGSTSINSTVGNGDSVVVSVNDQAGGGNGKAATIEVGSTTTLAATQSASVVNVGTAYAAKFNFGIPRGPTGPATSLSVGTVSTGTSVAVSISGSAGSQAISFVFPAAVTLSTATPSALGVAAAGTSTSASRSDHVHLLPTISYTALTNVPTSFTPASHTQAASTISDFATQAAKYGPVTSVNGLTGAVSITTGSTSSITLSDASPSPLGTASAGTSTSASRSDHVHLLPTISYTSLINVPTSFTPAAHTQAASTISDFATEVAKIGNVISVNGLTGAVTITTGAALSSATPQPLGTASAGTSTSASRSDHVHLLPTISYTSLINVPTSFTPAAHTQAASTISDFATEAAKYGPVTTVAGRTGAVTIAASDVSGLAPVATSGAYTSLTGIPTTFAPSIATRTAVGGVSVGGGLTVTSGGVLSVDVAPGAPTAITDGGGALSWTASTTGSSDAYDTQQTYDGGGTYTNYFLNVITTSVGNFDPTRKFRVRAKNAAGLYGPWGYQSGLTAQPEAKNLTIGIGFSTTDGTLTAIGGVSLSSATPSPLGTASAGTSTSASRSDHVHLLPTISYTALTNIPTSFAPAAHTQAASTISDFATEAAKYGPITTVAGRTGAVTISTADVSGFATEVAKIGNVISVNGLTGAVTITTGATSGITLSDASPSPLGTASAGTGTSASRSDHVHLLSIATTSAAGAIIVGAGLAVSSGVLSATGGTGTSSYTLPNATTTALGGVVVGSGLSVASGTISANVTSVQGRTGAVTVTASDLTAVTTIVTGITSATAVTNLMALSSTAYAAITSKHTATLYIVTG